MGRGIKMFKSQPYPLRTTPNAPSTIRGRKELIVHRSLGVLISFDAIIGVRVKASRLEKTTAAAMVSANSVNKRPTSPCRKVMGTKTETKTKVVATTAKPTCRVPLKAATSGVSPYSFIRREIFSSTTIASSTTRPIAKTIASRVKRLMENPRA